MNHQKDEGDLNSLDPSPLTEHNTENTNTTKQNKKTIEHREDMEILNTTTGGHENRGWSETEEQNITLMDTEDGDTLNRGDTVNHLK